MTLILVLAVIGLPLLSGLLSMALRCRQGWLVVVGQLLSVVAVLRLLWVTPAGEQAWQLPLGIPNYAFQLLLTRQSDMIALTVAIVGLLVSIYALGYMKAKPSQTRFWSTFAGFIAAMQLFVFAGDWISLLIGWELMSLASFLLIGFYNRKDDAVQAAKRAFMTTRTGDIGLYLAVLLLASTAGTSYIPATLTAASGSVAALAAIGLLLAGAVKAAQFPFDGWLRDAMAGPTPVSALLHSATMVAAGFLLLLKVQPMLTPRLSLLVALVGGITGIVAGMVAFAQTDLKRMLAASTSSQLGFMLLALGAGSASAALYFFIAQAFMKSGLFMAAGVFQQSAGSTSFTDIRGLGRKHRLTYSGFIIAGLGLAAIPPLAGFWSKDAVFSVTLTSPYRIVLVPLVLVGALMTGLYIAKAITMLVVGEKQGKVVTGLQEMVTGLFGAGLVTVVFGIFTGAFERFNEIELPQVAYAVPVGLSVAVIGLVLGTWLSLKRNTSGRFMATAVSGFYASQSLDKAISSILLWGSNAVSRSDAVIESTVFSANRIARFGSVVVDQTDRGFETAMNYIGHSITVIANYTEHSLERFFQNAVDGVATNARRFGEQLRGLQSGLVHHELSASLYGAGFLAITGVIIITIKEFL